MLRPLATPFFRIPIASDGLEDFMLSKQRRTVLILGATTDTGDRGFAGGSGPARAEAKAVGRVGGQAVEQPHLARAGDDERPVRRVGETHVVGVLLGHHGAG